MNNRNPQDRYANQMITKKLPSGKVVYQSLRPKSIRPNLLTDVIIPATDANRMDNLAHNAYGSSLDWWKIAAANGRVNGSLYFRPGTYIIIPK